VGDYKPAGIAALPDPCPLPSAAKKKGLREKEKLLYAPMSDVGDMLYDKDAVYININDHQVTYSQPEDKEGDTPDPKAGILYHRPCVFPLMSASVRSSSL
jgi:ribosome biogenesis protein BMS1